MRWQGFGSEYDTWEPIQHISHTGQVDMFYLKERSQHLEANLACLEFDNGPGKGTILADLSKETLRGPDEYNWMEANDFKAIEPGSIVSIYLEHADSYREYKVNHLFCCRYLCFLSVTTFVVFPYFY